MTTLESIGIDPSSHGFISADLLLSGKLSKLMEWAREMEVHHERMKTGLLNIANAPEAERFERNPPSYNYYAQVALGDLLPEIDPWNPYKSVATESHEN